VLCRSGSTNAVVFVTIENETGVANLIVWPEIVGRSHRAASGESWTKLRKRTPTIIGLGSGS
jgi:error-prone DNA polymerase